jgi:hypothetical protein
VFDRGTTTIDIIHFPMLVADGGGGRRMRRIPSIPIPAAPHEEAAAGPGRAGGDFATDELGAQAAGTVQANDATVVFGPTRANTCQTCQTNCAPYC